jgi:spore germination cell wall hydrolase CwlJ-like protein
MKKNIKVLFASIAIGVVLSGSAIYSFIYDKASEKQNDALVYNNIKQAAEEKVIKSDPKASSEDIKKTAPQTKSKQVKSTEPIKNTIPEKKSVTVKSVQATKSKTASSPKTSTKRISTTSTTKKVASTTTSSTANKTLASKTTVKASTKSSSSPISAKERDLLARLVHAEAEGESFAGKVAVASVVMNRVKSGLFANTITGVVYGKDGGYYQFTPVLDGRINNPASSTTYDAVDKVLSGGSTLPSKVMWFLNPSTSVSSWITSNKTLYKRIGNHDFYY